MERAAFLFKTTDSRRAEALSKLKTLLPDTAAQLKDAGADNFSLWRAENLIFGYYETPDMATLRAAGAVIRTLASQLEETADLLASPGNMRRMYTALGHPRTDKQGLGHRVFMTRLKPGMAEEYRARHAAIETDDAPEGPINNFTIWNCGDYICGYAELDPGFTIDRSAEGMEKDRPWETAMLEVMDWLTDDVNSLFGFQHEPVSRLYPFSD
jgi:L-rhamnose mutarotase